MHPITTDVRNGVPLHGHKLRDTVSIPFLSRLIDSCLLYDRRDHTQMLLQLFFQMFKKSFTVTFFYLFVANSFTNMLAPKPLNSYRFFKNKM